MQYTRVYETQLVIRVNEILNYFGTTVRLLVQILNHFQNGSFRSMVIFTLLTEYVFTVKCYGLYSYLKLRKKKQNNVYILRRLILQDFTLFYRLYFQTFDIYQRTIFSFRGLSVIDTVTKYHCINISRVIRSRRK